MDLNNFYSCVEGIRDIPTQVADEYVVTGPTFHSSVFDAHIVQYTVTDGCYGVMKK